VSKRPLGPSYLEKPFGLALHENIYGLNENYVVLTEYSHTLIFMYFRTLKNVPRRAYAQERVEDFVNEKGKTLTLKFVMETLGVSRDVIYEAAKNGRIELDNGRVRPMISKCSA
jgi:hypothetical protein